MQRQSLSHLEQRTGITEQDLIGAAKGVIWEYLRGERSRLSAEPLITEFVSVTSESHPNLERLNCPGTALLIQMVSSDGIDEVLLQHLQDCGPCLREYVDLLDALD